MPVARSVLFHLATSERWERAVRATSFGERWAWRGASRYVAGRTPAATFDLARELARSGVGVSIDLFGELVDDPAVAERAVAEYLQLADELAALPASTWLAVDLTHLGPDVDRRRCAERLAAIAATLPPGRRLQVGAEDHGRADAVLGCVLAAAGRGLEERLGATVQANFHRSAGDAEFLVEAGVHVRLVKGAYLEAPSRALPYGEATDVAYLRLAHRLAAAGARFSPWPPTTASFERPSSPPSDPGRSSSSSACARRCSKTWSPAACRSGSTCLRRGLVPLLDAPRRRVARWVRDGPSSRPAGRSLSEHSQPRDTICTATPADAASCASNAEVVETSRSASRRRPAATASRVRRLAGRGRRAMIGTNRRRLIREISAGSSSIPDRSSC